LATAIVFSAAFLIVRRQCSKTKAKVNIKKEIKKRFNSVIGDPDQMDTGNQRGNDRLVDQEAAKP
jgi:hypothetical protein